MKKTPKRALLDEAGRLYVLKKGLDELIRERDSLDDRIARTESRVAEAQRDFDTAYERLAGSAVNGNLGETGSSPWADRAEESLTPGKLPRRLLERMRQTPARIYTAAELRNDLEVGDVQQVRTALARLVGKGLVRRTNAKGEFTI